MSIGLFALWVGWPGGLALYACGRAARVMRRDVEADTPRRNDACAQGRK